MEAATAAGIDPTKEPAITAGPKRGGGATTTANPPPTVEDDDENINDLDSEVEMNSLISAVQTAVSGLVGAPLVIPYNAGSL